MTSQDATPAHEAEPPALSDAELTAFLERAREDPATARAVAVLHQLGLDLLRKVIRDTTMRLAALEAPVSGALAGAVDVRQLAGASRERENASRQRIELAEQIVLSALLNLDNPDWDPLDPSAGKTTGNNPLVTLLRL